MNEHPINPETGSQGPSITKARPRTSPLRRVLRVAGVVLAVGYVLGVTGGYVWLKTVRKVEALNFFDVALGRISAVRRTIGAQHFLRAKRELEARNYQAAILAYNAGLRNDPSNVKGRLEAASFLIAAGGQAQGMAILEDGLARYKDDPELVLMSLDLLGGIGQDARVLELLRGSLAGVVKGPREGEYRTLELRSLLNKDGPEAAKNYLSRFPSVKSSPKGPPVVARVQWESGDREAAVAMLQAYLVSKDAAYLHFAQAADYFEGLSKLPEARDVARQACARFPKDIQARLLLLGTLSPNQGGFRSVWVEEVKRYLKDFGEEPEALGLLADMAAKKGWPELARSLLEAGLSRWDDVTLLSLYYSDALMRTGHLREARNLLEQLDPQVQDSPQQSIQVKVRQIVVASAMGDTADVREYAQNVAANLSKTPEKFNAVKRQLEKMGIKEAVEEFSGPKKAVRNVPAKKAQATPKP